MRSYLSFREVLVIILIAMSLWFGGFMLYDNTIDNHDYHIPSIAAWMIGK